MNRFSDIRRYPLRFAFTLTAAGCMFLLAGATGYISGRHQQHVAGTVWAGHVIWWEVGVGAALLALALFQWRVAWRLLSSTGRAVRD